MAGDASRVNTCAPGGAKGRRGRHAQRQRMGLRGDGDEGGPEKWGPLISEDGEVV